MWFSDSITEALIHVCSNTGQEANAAGGGVASNASLVALTDGWTWHCVGCDSDEQLGPAIDRFINNSQVCTIMLIDPVDEVEYMMAQYAMRWSSLITRFECLFL